MPPRHLSTATPKRLFTRQEAAAYFGISERAFDDLRVKFHLPCRRLNGLTGEGSLAASKRGAGRIVFEIRDLDRVANAIPELGSRTLFESALREHAARVSNPKSRSNENVQG